MQFFNKKLEKSRSYNFTLAALTPEMQVFVHYFAHLTFDCGVLQLRIEIAQSFLHRFSEQVWLKNFIRESRGAQAVPSQSSHLAEAVVSYNIVIEVTCKNNCCKNMYTCKYIAGPESIPRHTMELNGGMFVPELVYSWHMFDLTR